MPTVDHNAQLLERLTEIAACLGQFADLLDDTVLTVAHASKANGATFPVGSAVTTNQQPADYYLLPIMDIAAPKLPLRETNGAHLPNWLP